MRYRIKKWSDYQHYKDRCPPWIKLHHALLTSEVWVMSNDATRTLAVACMLLASRNDDNDGTFNGDPEYIKRFAYLNTKPDFKPLIELDFIECLQDASTVLDKCNTEQSRAEQSRADISIASYSEEFEVFWKAYPKKTGKGEANKIWKKLNVPLQTVLNALDWQKKSKDWLKDNGQFIPMPATYLNQRRFDDEPPNGINGKAFSTADFMKSVGA